MGLTGTAAPGTADARPGRTPARPLDLVPPAEVADRFRAAGWWRPQTFLDDLYRTAARAPERPAIVSSAPTGPPACAGSPSPMPNSPSTSTGSCGALTSLGVSPGDPVAFQLPDWWETAALTLACLRVGAVAVPVLPTVRAHGLHRILDGTRARICVVPDVWEGFAHAQALADLAGRLPWLRHRVVLGDAAATGAVDFGAYFQRTAHERTEAGLRSFYCAAGGPTGPRC